MASDRLGRDGTELDPLGWEAFKSLLEKIELPALSSLSSLRERMSEVETFLCPPVWRCVETRARERLFDIFRGLETTQRTRALTARDVPGPLRVFEIISDSPGLETSWKSPFPRAWLQKTLKEMKAEAHKSFSHRRMLQDIESDDRIWKDWDKLDPGQQYHALAKLLTLKHRIKQVKEFNRQNKTSAAHPRPKRSYYPSVLTVDDLLGGPRRVHMHSQRDHAPMDRSTTSSQPLLSRAPMDQAQFEAKLVEAAPMERQVEQPTQRARGGGRHSRKQRFRTRNAAGTVSELAPTARSNAFSPRSSTPPRQPVSVLDVRTRSLEASSRVGSPVGRTSSSIHEPSQTTVRHDPASRHGPDSPRRSQPLEWPFLDCSSSILDPRDLIPDDHYDRRPGP